MEHEPCKSRGDCYHARSGRIGGPIGGRIQGRINIEKGTDFAALGRIGNREGKSHGGRIGNREGKSHGGCIGNREGKARGGRNRQAYRELRGRIGGTKTAEILRKKPNRQEQTIAALLMTFHPDVWADIIWQRRLPNGLRGVPDLRHPIGVIGEYDGGAHHWFGDRSADDAAKDAERRAAGYVVVRETDPYVLVAKFVYLVRQDVTRPIETFIYRI